MVRLENMRASGHVHFSRLTERGRLPAVFLARAEIDTETEHLGRRICRRREVDSSLLESDACQLSPNNA